MAISRGQKAGIGLMGALGGAGTGAAIGSIFPGIGTLIGAGLGSLIGAGGSALSADKTTNQIKKEAAKAAKNRVSFSPGTKGGFTPSAQPDSFWSGQPAGVETFNQYTPEQQQAFSQVLQQALGGLGKNQFDFAPIEDQARRGFAEKTVPTIAERFSSLGSGGSQRSSAFGQQLGAAGAGLETDLAAMKQNYGLQQQQMLQNLLGIGLQPQFESLYRPGSEGFGKSFARDLIGNLATGDNIKGGINALRDWRNRNQSSNAMQAAENAYAASQAQPQFQYNINPTTRLGSTSSLFNPGNIASGIKAPTTPYVPQVVSGQQMGGIQALKGLYGI